MQPLEMVRNRTTPLPHQLKAEIERKIRTFQIILAKCVNEEQSNWSQQLPYVMTAYWFSLQEPTGNTLQFLVFGQKLSLLRDCMFSNPQKTETTDIHELVHNKQQAFQRIFESLWGEQKTKTPKCYLLLKSSRPNIQRRTESFALSSRHRCWNNF